MLKKLSLSVVSFMACLGFAGQSALAASPVTTQSLTPSQLTNLQEFKLHPRLNVWGFTGNSTLVDGQFLMPVYGDQTRALYVAAEGNYVKNDSSWLGGLGAGYRQIVDNRIYGGYALVDSLHTPHNEFTILKPGLEMLSNVWDVNVNGYLSLDSKKKIGQGGWAGDDFGDYGFTRPTGHDYYDHFIQQYEEAGRGFDVEVARVIPHFEDVKLHVGVYHFDASNSGSTTGVGTRLTYDINKYAGVELADTYDNTKHNQFLVGVRFALGDYSKEEKQKFGIATRLLDPIGHDIVLTNSTLFRNYVDKGERKEHDNVWYFKKGYVSGNAKGTGTQQGAGTAENPYIGFTPGNYGAINPNIGVIDKYPLMYFAPGTYNFIGFSSRGIDDRFNLPNGWGMYGKNDNYTAPAIGDARPTFVGGLDMFYGAGSGNAPTTLNSIKIINNKGAVEEDDFSNAALYVENADNVILQNTDVVNSFISSSSSSSAINDPNVYAYAYGIYAKNSNLTFEKINNAIDGTNNVIATGESTMTGDMAQQTYSYGYGYGIYTDHSNINFNGGVNSVAGTGYGMTSHSSTSYDHIYSYAYGYGYGIYATVSSAINFNGGASNITGMGKGEGTATNNIYYYNYTGAYGYGQGYGYGIYANARSPVNFNGGVNTVAGFGNGVGLGTNNSTSTYQYDYGHGQGQGYGYGIYSDMSPVSFSGGSNTVNGGGTGDGTGIDVSSSSGRGYGYGYGCGIGIYLNTSSVNFGGGTNIIAGTGFGHGQGIGDYEGQSQGHGQGYGIDANSSTLTFTNGDNTISGYGAGVADENNYYSYSYGYGYGMKADNSTVNFNGGINAIAGTGVATTDGGISYTYANGYGYGIQAYHSIVTFSGGANTLTGIGMATGPTASVNDSYINSYGYGIQAGDRSIIDFTNSNDQKVTINATGDTERYGIRADGGGDGYGDEYNKSHIQRNGVDIDESTIGQMRNYINFNGSGSGSGNAVQWNELELPW